MPPRRRSTAPQRRNTSHQTYVYTISSKAQFQAALERAQVGSSLVRSLARSLARSTWLTAWLARTRVLVLPVAGGHPGAIM